MPGSPVTRTVGRVVAALDWCRASPFGLAGGRSKLKREVREGDVQKTSRMVAHYSAGATAERGAVARYL